MIINYTHVHAQSLLKGKKKPTVENVKQCLLGRMTHDILDEEGLTPTMGTLV